MKARRAIWVTSVVAILVVAGTIFLARQRLRRPPVYEGEFSPNRLKEWEVLNGSWTAGPGGVVRNDRDTVGARLLIGSANWEDYRFDVDMRKTGRAGNAGVVVRSSREETGIDSYYGYYIGLTYDTSLVIGKADFGWTEAAPTRAPAPVQPGRWFHLTVYAVGCDIVASAVDLETHKSSFTALHDADCFRSGRVGLRSMADGTEWRSPTLRPATASDLVHFLPHEVPYKSLRFPEAGIGI